MSSLLCQKVERQINGDFALCFAKERNNARKRDDNSRQGAKAAKDAQRFFVLDKYLGGSFALLAPLRAKETMLASEMIILAKPQRPPRMRKELSLGLLF